MLSRGGVPAGVVGSSKAVCGVNRATLGVGVPALDQHRLVGAEVGCVAPALRGVEADAVDLALAVREDQVLGDQVVRRHERASAKASGQSRATWWIGRQTLMIAARRFSSASPCAPITWRTRCGPGEHGLVDVDACGRLAGRARRAVADAVDASAQRVVEHHDAVSAGHRLHQVRRLRMAERHGLRLVPEVGDRGLVAHQLEALDVEIGVRRDDAQVLDPHRVRLGLDVGRLARPRAACRCRCRASPARGS